MTKKLNLIAVFGLATCVLALSGCGKEAKKDIDKTNNVTTTWENKKNTVDTQVLIVETKSKTNITETWSTDTKNTIISKEIYYEVPDGAQTSITVTATLDSGKNIKSISVLSTKSEGISIWYIKSFSNNISAAVIGKKLSAANVDKLAGASLTSNAFNLAIADLQTK